MALLTRSIPNPTHRAACAVPAAVASLVALWVLALSPAPARANPVAVDATVIAVREDRVYLIVADVDSTSFAAGTRLTFTYRNRSVASGTVLRSFNDGLAVAALTSGSLAKAKRLDRIETLAESRLPNWPSTLRIGFPSGLRPCPWFECREPGLSAPARPAYLRPIEALGEGVMRLVGDSRSLGGWPDTLIVRRFDDAADQEIALERGDLDVGVFWPGELSSSARRNLDWGGSLAVLDRGVVVCTRSDSADLGRAPTDSLPTAIFAELNQKMFRGDLLLWPRSGREFSSEDQEGASGFAVDDAVPGHASIEGFLNRGGERPANPTWRVTYENRKVADRGSVIPESARGGGVPVFAIRCAVVSRPELHAYISMLGAHHLANMNLCDSGPR